MDANLSKITAPTLLDDQPWLTANQMTGFVLIRSYKVVKKENIATINNEVISLTFPMIKADDYLTGQEAIVDLNKMQ